MQTTGKPKRQPEAVATLGFQIGVISHRKDTAAGSANMFIHKIKLSAQGKVLPLQHTILYAQEETRKIIKFMRPSYQEVLIS